MSNSSYIRKQSKKQKIEVETNEGWYEGKYYETTEDLFHDMNTDDDWDDTEPEDETYYYLKNKQNGGNQ
jgi:hypothetical protein